jgi:hypothetical protein
MKRSFFGFSQVPQRDDLAREDQDSAGANPKAINLTSFRKLSSTLSLPLGEHNIPNRSLGKPSRKHLVNFVDVIALSTCLLCLAGAIVVVKPSLSYATTLGYTRQIIAVGFLLGVMTQCMLRVVPHAFLLVEARFGRSTLQNFDGLLRWTPLADHLGVVWRVLLIVLLLLPLGLSIGYKRYTGGIGYGHVNSTLVELGPTAPPGTQGIGSSTTVTNATAPFIAATLATEKVPDFESGAKAVYGYNLVLLSKTRAAALDAPLPEHVASIQSSLGSVESTTISAKVRGTVSQYHLLTDADRTNASYKSAWQNGGWKTLSLYNGDKFGFLAVSNAYSDDPASYNSSWIYLGTFPTNDNADEDRVRFQNTANLVTVSRNHCNATWNLTSSSILLASATCGAPLWDGYQYYTGSQLGVADTMPSIMMEYLAPFATTRNASKWAVPSYAMAVASMYQSRIASTDGAVPVQRAGIINYYWSLDTAPNDTYTYDNLVVGNYVERYNGTLTSILQRPVLRADGSLYVLLAIQPMLSLIAFITTVLLRQVPLAHGFGLISLLAGVEREDLDLLAGATLSGQTKKAVSVAVEIVKETDLVGESTSRLRYVIGQRARGRVRQLDRRIKYH